ncbi:hypothetical protein [Xanthomonas phaseoli]|uniref:hypothetical protein n=1 Tax=Xanthomonas phaseoli TaxID=1985254 RepID=UPI001AD97385|nr:hypothetical protein [Xanthomonas phaseoli]MBO9853563.1 hypothetical protein [Xanthomonas phaseoli pv. dieffenbachiae]MBO9967296.1 hypothetical protein [Xanthomonas phaseoli pv. dieffenbachiae]MBO9989235.1 hypothetical protein [Xanthomonas phaseoli pv. dieffenbachiae]
MTIRTVFQLIEPHRIALLEEHRFYVEQAKKRLLSQFENISEEAERAQEERWQAANEYFDPEFHDMGDVAQAAFDYGVEFFQLLSDMHERTRLSVIAGMYHHWDKKWRHFLAHEMRWTVVIGPHTRRAVFSLDAQDLEKLLLALGLNVRSFPNFERLDAMRLIANVYKHGEGKAMDYLRRLYPEFVPMEGPFAPRFPDDSDLVVTDKHVDEFAAAIDEFWSALPLELTIDDDLSLNVPERFSGAFKKDLEESKS